jgi:hypothetical protein
MTHIDVTSLDEGRVSNDRCLDDVFERKVERQTSYYGKDDLSVARRGC